MLTEKQKKVCNKYSSYDETGHVRCSQCPLQVSQDLLMCRANSSYNRKTGEWELDEQPTMEDFVCGQDAGSAEDGSL